MRALGSGLSVCLGVRMYVCVCVCVSLCVITRACVRACVRAFVQVRAGAGRQRRTLLAWIERFGGWAG